MPDADAVASSLCKQAGVTGPENCLLCRSKIVTNRFAKAQQRGQGISERFQDYPQCFSRVSLAGCPLRKQLGYSRPEEQMFTASHHISLSQVAKACKDAVAERGAFALAIPGGSILKVPRAGVNRHKPLVPVPVISWGSSLHTKMTRDWWCYCFSVRMR